MLVLRLRPSFGLGLALGLKLCLGLGLERIALWFRYWLVLGLQFAGQLRLWVVF